MASNDEALYYPPLAGPTFIRIITLLPSLTCSTPLQITLDPANLDLSPRPEYEALSYTWEDQLPTHTIACNAFPLQTTANVSEALNRLRCTDRPRFLWIDAICINQNDQYEKTTQLSIMGSIFAYASRVNVWLSHPTGAMTEVFQYIQMTAAADLKMPSVSDDRIPSLKRGLEELASHQYWTRAWTVQEVALNNNCWVYIGSLEPMGMLEFQVMFHEVQGHTNVRSEALADPVVDCLYPVAFQRSNSYRAMALHFHDAKKTLDEDLSDERLRLILGKRAKYPLDVIFALRALMPQTLGQIPVNYKRDLSQVMREATVLLVPKLKRLGDLLEVVSLCPVVGGAPSWTFNFAFGGHLGNSCHFWGMWYASAMNPSKVTTSPYGHVLYTKGRIIDSATAVSDTFPHYTMSHQAKWHEETRDVLLRWRETCLEHDLRKNFEDSVSDILLAATDQQIKFANDIGQHVRFERIAVLDEDGTLLSKSVFKMHPVNDNDREKSDLNPETALALKRRKVTASIFSAWVSGKASTMRLDREDILHSTSQSSFSAPTMNSPALSSRRLFATKSGRMALCKDIETGDAVALLSGCNLPFALLPVPGNNKTFTVKQPVLMPGIMMGEMWPDKEEDLEEICLV